MVSLVIPCFNEEERLGSSLEKLALFLKTFPEESEVIIVDDFSTDKTQEVAENFRGKIPNLVITQPSKGKGKGAAVNQGFLQSQGEIVVFTDADFSTPIEEVYKLLQPIKNGTDIAIGSRALNRQLIKRHQNIVRETMGRVFNLLVRMLTVQGIVDTQCGFKAFLKKNCEDIFKEQRIWGFGFDVELLFLAQRKGLKINEVGVIWYNHPTSTINPIRDSFTSFLDLLKIRLLHAQPNKGFIDRFLFLVKNKPVLVLVVFLLVGVFLAVLFLDKII